MRISSENFSPTGQALSNTQTEALKNLDPNAPWYTKLIVKHRRLVGVLIPFTIVQVIWWSCAIKYSYWDLFPDRFYISITMIFGSMIAGSFKTACSWYNRTIKDEYRLTDSGTFYSMNLLHALKVKDLNRRLNITSKYKDVLHIFVFFFTVLCDYASFCSYLVLVCRGCKILSLRCFRWQRYEDFVSKYFFTLILNVWRSYEHKKAHLKFYSARFDPYASQVEYCN